MFVCVHLLVYMPYPQTRVPAFCEKFIKASCVCVYAIYVCVCAMKLRMAHEIIKYVTDLGDSVCTCEREQIQGQRGRGDSGERACDEQTLDSLKDGA